jgi:BON domain
MSRKLPHKERDTKSPEKGPRRTHHRTYGYRGYGSGFGRGTDSYGGAVHWGRGFGGVGVVGGYGGQTLPRAGFFTAEAWDHGPYVGQGPQGYSRPDERIREDICDELTRRGDIDPRRVLVTVRSGEVTLEGTVESLEMRRVVDDVASACTGVTQVHDRLQLEPAGVSPSTKPGPEAREAPH